MTAEPLALSADEFALLKQILNAFGGLAPISPDMTMTPAQVAEFRERFDAAMAERGAFPLRVLSLPPPLSPQEVRSLLRECVTVVRPGEVLVIRVPWNTSQRELREYGESLAAWNASHEGHLEAVIVPAEELGIAEAAPEPAAREKTGTFLDDCRTYRCGIPSVDGAVRITHDPTGIAVDGASAFEATGMMAEALVAAGKITVNEGREAMGMKPWPVDAMVPPVDVT